MTYRVGKDEFDYRFKVIIDDRRIEESFKYFVLKKYNRSSHIFCALFGLWMAWIILGIIMYLSNAF